MFKNAEQILDIMIHVDFATAHGSHESSWKIHGPALPACH